MPKITTIKFIFSDFCEPKEDFISHGRIVRLPRGITSRDELLAAYQRLLNFPDYFGANFDALADCLTDLGWIDERSVCIVHDEIPNIGPQDLAIYLDILREVISSWEGDMQHDVLVVFPRSSESRILGRPDRE